MSEKDEVEARRAKAMTIWRKANPRARRSGPTATVHSGGAQTLYTCICGSGHSEATRNRGKTKHYTAWCERHQDCAVVWCQRLGISL